MFGSLGKRISQASHDAHTAATPAAINATFWIFTFLVTIGHVGGATSLIILMASIVVGGALWRWYPPYYVGFVLQVFFFIPLVRRVIDYQNGWNSTNPIVLAPFLVAGFSAIGFFNGTSTPHIRRGAPYLVILGSICYGFLIGMLRNGLSGAAFEFLNWSVPIWMAWYIAVSDLDLQKLRTVIEGNMVWGLFLVSIYGILQFIQPLNWDASWVMNSLMYTSLGWPLPFTLRVFSTLNSCGPLSCVLMAGFIICITARRRLNVLILPCIVVCLLLTLVRSAWGGAVLGVIMLIPVASREYRARLVVIILVGTMAGSLAMLYPPFAERIQGRLDTFSNLSEDESLATRLDTYVNHTSEIFGDPIGFGLGSTGTGVRLKNANSLDQGYDSAFLCVPFDLGWLGTIGYFCGMVATIRSMFIGRTTSMFGAGCKAVSIALIVQMFFGNSITGVEGMMTWMFIALSAKFAMAENAARSMEQPAALPPGPPRTPPIPFKEPQPA